MNNVKKSVFYMFLPTACFCFYLELCELNLSAAQLSSSTDQIDISFVSIKSSLSSSGQIALLSPSLGPMQSNMDPIQYISAQGHRGLYSGIICIPQLLPCNEWQLETIRNIHFYQGRIPLHIYITLLL